MNRPNHRNRAKAFTLVELLVVIGIIGLLVGILIPVVSKMRHTANNAATSNEMMQISQAIQSYYNDFQQYPGATPDEQFGALGPQYDPSLANLTSTEDLVMSLMGGYDISSGKIKFNYTWLGKGAINLGSTGQKNAYMDVQPKMLSVIPTAANPNLTLKDTGEWLAYTAGKDTTIPEFIDQFNDSRPILYVRNNLRASRANANKYANFNKTFDPKACYNLGSVSAYFRPNLDKPGTPESSKLDDVFGDPVTNQTLINNYFAAPNINGAVGFSARGAGSYLLISAGLDRRYGTPDDIIFSSAGGGQ